MKANKIQKIEIRNIWGKYNFRWENLNPDVNILTGINGSGKTTFFNIIDALLSADIKRLKLYNIEAEVTIDNILISFRKDSTLASVKQKLAGVNYLKISTFDVPIRDRRKMGKEDSPLLSELTAWAKITIRFLITAFELQISRIKRKRSIAGFASFMTP